MAAMKLKRLLNGSPLWLVIGSFCSLFCAEAMPVASPLMSLDFVAVLRSGKVHQLRKTLESGSSAQARDSAGNTPLMHAAVYGDLSCLRVLLEHGAEVNTTNAAGATGLMRAAPDYEKVRLLIQHGAEVNARSALGNSALMLAARSANSHRTVKLLLAHGADAKATNYYGATALMAAAAGGDEKSARLLIQHGADVNAQPTADEPGFIFGGARSALMWAAFRGDINIAKLLIDAGAEINAPGGLGAALAQAAWVDRAAVARVLIKHGADVNQAGPADGYTALHWAASTEDRDPTFVKLLLDHNADPNRGGGEKVDAFLGIPQTPLMLARRRGDTPVRALLTASGATNATSDRAVTEPSQSRQLPEKLDTSTLRAAIGRAIPPLQDTSLRSKQAYLSHPSRQDCTSCHQQYLPLAAIGSAEKCRVPVDEDAKQQLVKMVLEGELKNFEVDWQPLFHPDPVYAKGYTMLGLAEANLPADAGIDASVHHLAVIQDRDGNWFNNLPRPPLQGGDIGATALAVQALQRYPLPGRKAEFASRVERARQWLWNTKPQNNDGRVYQLLGLAWADEPARKLQSFAKALLAEQRDDGGWSQLPGLKSDAYATAQAVYALRVGASLDQSHPAIDRGLRFLLRTQLDDGTWHVRRRAFPFQPTMNSGFPHGRDSWISAAATSWAVMALSLPEDDKAAALAR